MKDAIHICLETRSWLATTISNILQKESNISEQQFAAVLKTQLESNANVYPKGWYEPPPYGISPLFSKVGSFERLQYDTLRKEQFWPRADCKLSNGSVGMIYASPVDKSSGIIGDFGLTIYLGEDQVVQSHIANCLHTIESAANYAEVGMELRELYDHAQRLFKENELHNARTVTWTDTTGTNLGHTIPWSDEAPTAAEQEIINSRSFDELKDLISHKRVHVNQNERFKIPADIAFTFEARLESASNPSLPNTYFHLIVSFQSGIRVISSNFKEVFDTTSMSSWVHK